MKDAQDLRALALELLGDFARLQETIDGIARMFFDKRTPNLAKFVNDSALKRLPDDKRIDLLKNLFTELEVEKSEDLKAVFNQVKKIRDAIAHASNLRVEEDDTLVLQKSLFIDSYNAQKEPAVVSREQLSRMSHYCAWLDANLCYLLYASDLTKQVFLGSREMSCIQPSGHPDNWDGKIWVSKEDN